MQFAVDGKPFFPLGGQSHNSSAYNADEIASAIAGVSALNGNMLEAPVYWEQVEKEEGNFDFASLDELVAACRKADIKLIILWFGTWKNGEMRYVPEWVKENTERFHRVVGFDGNEMTVLSGYCSATLEADAKAFEELCSYISNSQEAAETIIAIQVENEPGILGSDRDYSVPAGKAVKENVPGSLIGYIEGRGCGPVFECWTEYGTKRNENWLDTFGFRGFEYCEAWSIASYIDYIATAGQKHLQIPMYTNAWLGGDGWQVPGFYPAGGPIAPLLDIWKHATPHLATLAPDIYISHPVRYRTTCAAYARDDNPLFVPESGANNSNAMNMIRSIADYNAVGYACFAIDSVLDLEGNLRDDARLFAASFMSTKAMLPLIQKYQGTGKIHAVYHEDDAMFLPIRLERYNGMVPYVDIGLLRNIKDHRHSRRPEAENRVPCFGYIIEAGPYELYLSGEFHLHLVPNKPPGWINALRFPTVATPPDFLSVEEGTLDEDGRFTPLRKRNGDEVVFGGFWTAADVGVVRVRLNPIFPS